MSSLPFFQRFRTRLTLLMLLLVAPAFGLVLYGNFAQRRLQATAVQNSATALAELVAANHEDVVKSARQLLATLTQFPFLVLSNSVVGSQIHFANLLKLSPDYVNFGLVETNGALFCSGASTNTGVDLGDRSYFQRVLQTRRFAIGDYQVGRVTAAPSLNFGMPIFDGDGTLRRVLFASLRINKMSAAASHVRLPEGGEILIVDRTGTVLVHQPSGGAPSGVSLAGTPLGKRILDTERGSFKMAGLDGVRRLQALTSIRDGHAPGLYVCVSVPLSVSMAQANRDLARNCAILAVVALCVLAASWAYSQSCFLRPINALMKAARSLGEGDLTARIAPATGPAELVKLGAVFNEMAGELEARQTQLMQLNDVLRGEIAERKRAENTISEQAQRQRQLEQQFLRAQRMESLGALAGGVAHDLNNALGPILMGSELLRPTVNGNAESVAWLDLIVTSAQRCAQMVKQILNFAKGAGSKDGLISLPKLLHEMERLASETFPKSISVRCQCAPNLKTFRGDSTQLHQVLLNLCVNARDAMPQGGTLTLAASQMDLSTEQRRVHPDAGPGPHLLLSITDTGTGMEPQTMERIFEPFFTTKGLEKGTGLGLSTVAAIVKNFEGFVEVQSAVGQGTVFQVFLPMPADAPAEEPAPKLEALPTGRGELILAVDDERFVLELAKTTLEAYGYKVITGRDGLEAISAVQARRQELALLLIDTDMPVLNGIKAIKAIHRLAPKLPIIRASGSHHAWSEEEAARAGVTTTLRKPYGLVELLTAVAQSLQGR